MLDGLNLQEIGFAEFIQIALKVRFLAIPEDEGHSRYFFNGFAIAFGIAASNQHFGFRILSDDSSNRFAGFLVSDICYCAGVHDVNICNFVRINDCVAVAMHRFVH